MGLGSGRGWFQTYTEWGDQAQLQRPGPAAGVPAAVGTVVVRVSYWGCQASPQWAPCRGDRRGGLGKGQAGTQLERPAVGELSGTGQ